MDWLSGFHSSGPGDPEEGRETAALGEVREEFFPDDPGTVREAVTMVDENDIKKLWRIQEKWPRIYITARRQNFGQGCRLASSK